MKREGYVDRLRRNGRLSPISHDIGILILLLMPFAAVIGAFVGWIL